MRPACSPYRCGNVAATARDAASFYHALLGPGHSIVSSKSLKTMATTTTIDKGWSTGKIDYGYGLMIHSVDQYNTRNRRRTRSPSAVGVTGVTVRTVVTAAGLDRTSTSRSSSGANLTLATSCVANSDAPRYSGFSGHNSTLVTAATAVTAHTPWV